MKVLAFFALCVFLLQGCAVQAIDDPATVASEPAQSAASGETFSDAAFAEHVEKLRANSIYDDFHIVVEKPFVVIGNGTKANVQRWASGTVRWAVEKLKKQYFAKNPNHIINIFLFTDKASYEKNCELVIGYKPTTPYGFYSSHKKALVMNISTGGGTLVHEIVHPFIESNFPDCPAWFNEGLASLYEQSQERSGKIWGSTNWRLRGLQLQIESQRLPTTEQLCKTTTEEFYRSEVGDSYAQARYLCYYLQQNELLGKFYRAFTKNVKSDPSGFATLTEILGRPDMDKFDAQWQEYCLGLKYP